MPEWKSTKHSLEINRNIAEFYLFWCMCIIHDKTTQEFCEQHALEFGEIANPDRRTREIARDYLHLHTYTNRKQDYQTTEIWDTIIQTLGIRATLNDDLITQNIDIIENSDFGFIHEDIDVFLRSITIPETNISLLGKFEEVLQQLPKYKEHPYLAKDEIKFLLTHPPMNPSSWDTFMEFINSYRTTKGTSDIDLEWRNSNMVNFTKTMRYDTDMIPNVGGQPYRPKKGCIVLHKAQQ